MPNTEAPRNAPLGSRAPRVAQERHDRALRPAAQAGEDHRGEGAVRAADVVVEDVVDAGVGRLHGDVDVVLAHRGVGEVREAAVAAAQVRAAPRRLDHLLAVPVVPGVLGSTGSRKATMRPTTRPPRSWICLTASAML